MKLIDAVCEQLAACKQLKNALGVVRKYWWAILLWLTFPAISFLLIISYRFLKNACHWSEVGLDKFGQFGDMYGCLNCAFAVLAFVLLIQSNKLQREANQNQWKEHQEDKKAQEDFHKEMIQKQEEFNSAQLKMIRQNHKDDLDVQKMIALGSEIPTVSALDTNPCRLYNIGFGSTKAVAQYAVLWNFCCDNQCQIQNPVFVLSINDEIVASFSPGRLPCSNERKYEVSFWVDEFRLLCENDNINITMLYNNRLGGCFIKKVRYQVTQTTPLEHIMGLATDIKNQVNTVSKLCVGNYYHALRFHISEYVAMTIEGCYDKMILESEFNSLLTQASEKLVPGKSMNRCLPFQKVSDPSGGVGVVGLTVEEAQRKA